MHSPPLPRYQPVTQTGSSKARASSAIAATTSRYRTTTTNNMSPTSARKMKRTATDQNTRHDKKLHVQSPTYARPLRSNAGLRARLRQEEEEEEAKARSLQVTHNSFSARVLTERRTTTNQEQSVAVPSTTRGDQSPYLRVCSRRTCDRTRLHPAHREMSGANTWRAISQIPMA